MASAVEPVRLAIVVPTRNRARMAIRSVESVLASGLRDDRVGVLVSDNSTDPRESELLDRFVAGVGRGVTLVRPPSPLPMTAHWNFALDRALERAEHTHVTFLTDRMLVRTQRIRQVVDTLAAFPDELVSYAYDRIDDVRRPVLYRPLPRSGGVFRIESATLLAMSARMAFPSCLPRMLNSVAPRRHLDAMKARFGAVFSSLSPDFCFCYRSLGMRASILFFDRSVLVTYGFDRSNGNSFARGVMTRDSNDYVKEEAFGEDSFITPYPEFLTIGNGVSHEYLVAARESGDPRFGPLALADYQRMLATEVRKYEDPRQVAASLARLRQRGWTDPWPAKLKRWRRASVEGAVGLLARRFDDVGAAIAHAQAHEGPAWPWLPHPARKLGAKVLEPGRPD